MKVAVHARDYRPFGGPSAHHRGEYPCRLNGVWAALEEAGYRAL